MVEDYLNRGEVRDGLMSVSSILHEIEALGGDGVPGVDLVPGLSLVSYTEPTPIEAVVYTPVVCLNIQGRKETAFGDRWISQTPGDMVVVSHDVPVLARVIEASPESPYLALIATIDVSILRDLRGELGPYPMASHESVALETAQADPEVLSVFKRYASLAQNELEAKVLAPLVRKELHFRLLSTRYGARLRAFLDDDSYSHRISEAIKILRKDFRQRLEMNHLAQSIGMSPSTFYQHFKVITSTTPLQYQKDLRLTEARRLLIEGRHTVSSAAFEVGYESASQFSREYTRKFGASPKHDRPVMSVM